MYSGLVPNLIGVVPEKAIKLAANAQLREMLSDRETGKVTLGNEILAGGLTGLCQVVATTPMEAAKIHLQVSSKQSPMQVVRKLGFSGMYRGTAATLLRDIPFSMIFFTLNSLGKEKIAQSKDCTVDEISVIYSLGLGVVSGAVSAVAATPADVIKT